MSANVNIEQTITKTAFYIILYQKLGGFSEQEKGTSDREILVQKNKIKECDNEVEDPLPGHESSVRERTDTLRGAQDLQGNQDKKVIRSTR